MGCDCGKKRERWIVTLPGGMKITKSSEQAAKVFADRHPGATYAKA
jgi:hypothetical protein